MASDSARRRRDNFATFICKMTVFERGRDRVIVLLSFGNLAGNSGGRQYSEATRAKRGTSGPTWHLERAAPCFDVATIVSDAVRSIERGDGRYVAERGSPFNASFIIGGQIRGEPLRLFRTFAEVISSKQGSRHLTFRAVKPNTASPFSTGVVTRDRPVCATP